MSQYFAPDPGGGSTRANTLAKAFRQANHEVVVLTAFPHYPYGNVPRDLRNKAFSRHSSPEYQIIRVWVPAVPHKGFVNRVVLYTMFSINAIWASLLVHEVDVVWVMGPNYFITSTGVLLRMLKKAFFVLDIQDLWPEALANLEILRSGFALKFLLLLRSFSYRLTDSVVVLNNPMKRILVQTGIDRMKIHLVQNVVDTDLFKPLAVVRPPSMTDRTVVMYSGNIGPNYDFDTVLSVASELRQRSDLVFVIRGSGESLEPLKKKTEDMKLLNVQILEAVPHPRQVAEILNWADIFLLPMKPARSPEASYPIKLLEYLSIGRPVIFCGRGPIGDLLQDAKCGLAVPPTDAKALVRAVRILSEDRLLMKEMGVAARQLALEKFSHNSMSVALSSVLASTMIQR